MRYEVIKDFVDLHDADHQYRVGDAFPRQGVRVAKSRVDELAGSDNKLHTPLIAQVGKEEDEPEPEEESTPEPEKTEDETEE